MVQREVKSRRFLNGTMFRRLAAGIKQGGILRADVIGRRPECRESASEGVVRVTAQLLCLGKIHLSSVGSFS